MKRVQAQYLLRRTRRLKYESTRNFTLAPKDLEAAEVLGKASKRFTGREKDAGTTRASARSEPAMSLQRNKADQQLDSDAWLASILDLDQFSEEKKGMPQDRYIRQTYVLVQ